MLINSGCRFLLISVLFHLVRLFIYVLCFKANAYPLVWLLLLLEFCCEKTPTSSTSNGSPFLCECGRRSIHKENEKRQIWIYWILKCYEFSIFHVLSCQWNKINLFDFIDNGNFNGILYKSKQYWLQNNRIMFHRLWIRISIIHIIMRTVLSPPDTKPVKHFIGIWTHYDSSSRIHWKTSTLNTRIAQFQ